MIHGVEANIGIDGQLDLTAAEAASFELVLAAPHSRLRKDFDQTARLIAAIQCPSVRILAHPRGRMAGSRAGVIADWDLVFATAAANGVAVEIDGDPSRQDLDHTLAKRALEVIDSPNVRIGTAGWSIPRDSASRFASAGTHLQRYANELRCAEINSSFYRPHTPGTYARWRDSTPDDFRFAVKMPRTRARGW